MVRKLKASKNKSVDPIAMKVDHTKKRLKVINNKQIHPIANKVSKLKQIVKSSQKKRKSIHHHRLKKSKKANEEAVVLSMPTSPSYAGCTASTQYTDNDWSCDKGLVGTMSNGGKTQWASKN